MSPCWEMQSMRHISPAPLYLLLSSQWDVSFWSDHWNAEWTRHFPRSRKGVRTTVPWRRPDSGTSGLEEQVARRSKTQVLNTQTSKIVSDLVNPFLGVEQTAWRSTRTSLFHVPAKGAATDNYPWRKVFNNSVLSYELPACCSILTKTMTWDATPTAQNFLLNIVSGSSHWQDKREGTSIIKDTWPTKTPDIPRQPLWTALRPTQLGSRKMHCTSSLCCTKYQHHGLACTWH